MKVEEVKQKLLTVGELAAEHIQGLRPTGKNKQLILIIFFFTKTEYPKKLREKV
jgi:hypothetical protein